MAKKDIMSQNELSDLLVSDKKIEAEEKVPRKVQMYYLLMVCPELKEGISIINHSDVFSVLEQVRKIDSKNEDTTIDLLLNSNGGDIYAAYKIMCILREHCNHLNVIVPLYAKSAATLMTLAANRIVMGPQSELGPLDLPTEHPIAEGRMMSALDAVRPIEFLAGMSTSLAFRLGLLIRREIGLPRRDSIEIALQFASDYIEPVMSKLDPLIVNECYRELDIAGRYARECLSRYMFARKKNKEEMAQLIAHQLVWGYPSHDFAICINEAKKIGLEVCHNSEYPQWDTLWETFKMLNAETEGHVILTRNPSVKSVAREIGGFQPST